MARTELKYLVPLDAKDELRKDILPHLQYDCYSDKRPNKEYTVRSIYLDTDSLTCYHEKEAGVRVRNKFRIRGYNDREPDSKVFAEIKRKEDGFVSKDRVLIPFCALNNFLRDADFSKVLNHSIDYKQRIASARNFFFYHKRDKLKPVINVVYEREAFECKFGSGLRITFDSFIRSSLTQTFDNLYDELNMKLLHHNEFVLEVKFGRIIPSWVPSVINKYNLLKQSVSKYAFSMDLQMKSKISFHSNIYRGTNV